MQNRELLLQELDAVIGNLLLHLYVEVRVAKSLVLCKLLAKLITEFLAHLLRHERNVDQLLGLRDFLFEFQFKAHVHFDLALQLGSQGVDMLLLVQYLAIE